MKPSLKSMVCRLAAGGLGFAAALVSVRWLTSSHDNPAPSPRGMPAETMGRLSPPQSPASLPAPREFMAMEPAAKLEFSVRLRALSAEQRDAFLKECLSRSEPERTALLSLLLLDWAATDPAAACEWALNNLDGETKRQCIHDLVYTWAAWDGAALAEWYNDLAIREGRKFYDEHSFDILNPLEQHDPVSLARFAEMECNHHSVCTGMDFDRCLRTHEAIKDISVRLNGHIDYIDDLTELRRELSMTSSGRNAPHKWGWNELFEDTAVAWHRLDPEGCEAWLATWPENAQMVARHFIEKAEAKPGAAAPAPAPAPQSPARPTSAAPAADASDQARRNWAAWWREDAAAAEAFLNAAEWPAELKFRARAKAYSSPP